MITREWLDQNPEYTCGCGIYVHPSRINPNAIHIPDCPFAREARPELARARSFALVVCPTCGDECDGLLDYENHARCHQFGHHPTTNEHGDRWCIACGQRLLEGE